MELEPAHRHAELIIAGMGVPNGVSAPGSRDGAAKAITLLEHEADEGTSQELDAMVIAETAQGSLLLETADATVFRGLAARANYPALGRPDIQFALKKIAGRMARPRGHDWQPMKRSAPYLVPAPRAVSTSA